MFLSLPPSLPPSLSSLPSIPDPQLARGPEVLRNKREHSLDSGFNEELCLLSAY